MSFISNQYIYWRRIFCRYGLNKFLINKAEEAGAKIYFGHGLDSTNSDFRDGPANNDGGDVGCILTFDITSPEGVKSKKYVNCACPVLACDGGGSRVRHAMKGQGFTEFSEILLGIET
jgi:hypothetical protein